MTRRLLDISRTLSSDALVYPGDPPLHMEPVCTIGPEGAAYNVLALHWTTHVLTHLDAPRHFFPEGASIENLAPERFMGPALVVAVEGPTVRERDVPANVSGLNLLFKTRNSADWDPKAYNRNHVYLEGAAAEAIAARGANLVGLDYLSVDRFGDESYPAHRALLGAGVLILEGLDLSGVKEGRYTLYALPLKIADGDGSPVRAVLAME